MGRAHTAQLQLMYLDKVDPASVTPVTAESETVESDAPVPWAVAAVRRASDQDHARCSR